MQIWVSYVASEMTKKKAYESLLPKAERNIIEKKSEDRVGEISENDEKIYMYVKVKNDSREVLIFSYYWINVVYLVAVTGSMTRKCLENISA